MENKINKDRSSNFSLEELKKLKDLIEKYPIIVNKKTDQASSKQKDHAWAVLTDEYNCDNKIFRTKKQLIYKFNNLKKNARKELAYEKKERRQTGGGPPPTKPSDTSEWLCGIMGESIVGLPSTYDSDFTQENNDDNETVQDLTQIMPDDNGLTLTNPFLDQGIIIDIQEEGDDLITKTSKCIIEMPDSMPQEKKHAFDTSTPKAMLKKPVSLELDTGRKRRILSTPLETRKRIIAMTNEKEQYIKKKATREDILIEFAKEEHKKNMEHKEESHHMEIEFRKKMNELMLKKASLEIEIEEEKLIKLKLENKKLIEN